MCNSNYNYIRSAKVGQCFYAPHRSAFGVWTWNRIEEGFASGTFVMDFNTREEARNYVFAMNGWTQKRCK